MMNVLKKTIAALAVAVFAMAFFAGTAAGASYGRLSYNSEATEILKTYNPVPGYRYFVIGYSGEPDGILGVADGFTFESIFWKEISIESHRGRSALLAFQMAMRTCGEKALAYDITDRTGRKIGLWFADKYYPSVEVLDGDVLRVSVPARTRNLRSEEF